MLAAPWENTEVLVGNANGFEMGKTLRIIIVGRQVWNVAHIMDYALLKYRPSQYVQRKDGKRDSGLLDTVE